MCIYNTFMFKKITSFIISSTLLFSFLPNISFAQTSPTAQPLVTQGDMVYLGKFSVPSNDGTGRGNSVDSLDYGGFGLGMGADGWVAEKYITKATVAMTDEDYRQNKTYI